MSHSRSRLVDYIDDDSTESFHGRSQLLFLALKVPRILPLADAAE
jgi:hypothetical protein